MPVDTNDSPAVAGVADSNANCPSSQVLSIVVLTYNRRALLRDCLETLIAQADPEMQMEILVVDDGSTDGTGDLVRELRKSHPRIRYCPQPHGGIAAARNRGIVSATGTLVAIVADDYLLATDYARTVVSFFRDHPDAQVVRFKLVAADDRFMSRVGHAYQEASVQRRLVDGWEFSGYREMWRLLRVEEKLTTKHGLEAAGAAAFRREVFDRVGLFDESFARAEDSDFTVRLRTAGIPIHYCPFHLVRHRYDSSLRDVLRTAYKSGRFRWRYHSKYADGLVSLNSLVRLGLKMKLSVLYWACWRARQTGSLVRFVTYVPFMLLIEAATKAGFMAEARDAGKQAKAAAVRGRAG